MSNWHEQKKTKFFPLFIFAASMGFLEAIVVVYLRELYYPDGFRFPLQILPQWLMGVEIVREFSTLFMLFAVAWIAGKSFLQRLSVFLFIFGIWDIFYYVALKLFLSWPESLLTWDILFLIPITWLGPVLAPVICSITMILMTFIFEYFRLKNNSHKITGIELGLMITGATIIYFTFTYDLGRIIFKGNYFRSLLYLTKNQNFTQELSNYVPDNFLWGIFTIGLLVIFSGIFLYLKRNLSVKN
ncbi:hypothetical protein GM418_28505 [Maribellus comscasis]|uniref:Uncharacterized protein n=1 Tax=Maribellus comscasis TaxID=2681766 RepID=A0A6I6K1I4_9BACT|nr:hypothetical protein [Maribellus comscasis]QGY47469.1 hypothetical protein GM418_28505 [Maribellus comscasis]